MNNRIDIKTLRKICLMGIDDFKQYGSFDESGNMFIDHGSNILFVAHLDTVIPAFKGFISGSYWNDKKQAGDNLIMSLALDDRLGVYTILHFLPAIGIQADILLTQDEELCHSTAQYFRTDKVYNWIAEFDRMMIDPVAYQFDDNKNILRKKLKALNIILSYGSYTDIKELSHLKRIAINWGIGYQSPHSGLCHVYESDYITCIKQFVSFYNVYKDASLPYKPSKVKSSKFISTRINTGSATSKYIYTCESCHKEDSSVMYTPEFDKDLCDSCYNRMSSAKWKQDKHIFCDACEITSDDDSTIKWYPESKLYLCDACHNAYKRDLLHLGTGM